MTVGVDLVTNFQAFRNTKILVVCVEAILRRVGKGGQLRDVMRPGAFIRLGVSRRLPLTARMNWAIRIWNWLTATYGKQGIAPFQREDSEQCMEYDYFGENHRYHMWCCSKLGVKDMIQDFIQRYGYKLSVREVEVRDILLDQKALKQLFID